MNRGSYLTYLWYDSYRFAIRGEYTRYHTIYGYRQSTVSEEGRKGN